jgi:hypothetical protein
MAVAKQAIPAMRAADPNCTIVGPAVESIESPAQSWLTTCFQQGLLNLVDAVSVQPYRSASPETAVNDYAAVKSLITEYHRHGSIPIVSSEWGYSATTVTAQTQGDYLARMYLVNLSQGIPLSIWYDWKNDGTDPNNNEQNFGTVTADYVPKAAYAEMQLLTHSLEGESFYQQLNDGNSDDWLLIFRTVSGQQTLAAWTAGIAHTITVPTWGSLNLTSTPLYVNPVAEPDAGALLATGLIGVLAYGWWKRR